MFVQFYSNLPGLNPALAGSAGKLRLGGQYRYQQNEDWDWYSNTFSVDGAFGNSSSGWNIYLLQDQQGGGVYQQQEFGAAFAHRVALSKGKFLAMGLRTAVYQKQLDWSKLIFEDQLDERGLLSNPTGERFGRSAITNPDFSAGLVFMTDQVQAGLVLEHLSRPAENFVITSDYRRPMRMTLHLSNTLRISHITKGALYLSPGIVYRREGGAQYTNLGFSLSTEVLRAGLWYRLDQAVVMGIGFTVDGFQLNYSYELLTQGAALSSPGVHEWGISHTFGPHKKHRLKNRYKGQCPVYKHLI